MQKKKVSLSSDGSSYFQPEIPRFMYAELQAGAINGSFDR